MQENCEDFYESYEGEDEYGGGCCLLCFAEEKRDGCLCYECKCKSCFWYNENDYNRYCEKKYSLKRQRELNFLEKLKKSDWIKTKLGIQINDTPQKKLEEFKYGR